jgi:homogentisate phytyltransferase/homogentisate geranylgeranyltransferase
MIALRTLWRFSRPHTIIGSVISICTLYVIVCDTRQEPRPGLLLLALAMGIACNLFIVGINQVADVDIDRINKPWLPIPSGTLAIGQAWAIAYAALTICLGIALFISPWLFLIIALATGIGWTYSMPPFHFKRHHLSAAIAITTVRGVLINTGGFLVFNHLVNGRWELPGNVLVLTCFIVAFSIAIAWFKDLPDVVGDARHGIRTLALRYSPRTALIAGHLLVGSAYIATITVEHAWLAKGDIPDEHAGVLMFGHAGLFLLFILNALVLRLRHGSIQKFYLRFWWFFFAEYLLYLSAYAGPWLLGRQA